MSPEVLGYIRETSQERGRGDAARMNTQPQALLPPPEQSPFAEGAPAYPLAELRAQAVGPEELSARQAAGARRFQEAAGARMPTRDGEMVPAPDIPPATLTTSEGTPNLTVNPPEAAAALPPAAAEEINAKAQIPAEGAKAEKPAENLVLKDGRTDAEVAAEREAARQKQALKDQAAAPLPTGTGDLQTPDMFDQGASDTALFSSKQKTGPGAAAPADVGFVGDRPALKNATTDEERAQLGLEARSAPERRGDDEVIAEARKLTTVNPRLGHDLVDRVLSINPFRSKQLSDVELAVLLDHRRMLHTERTAAVDAGHAAQTPEDVAAARQRLARVNGELQRLYDAVSETGSATARALRFRNAVLKDDWTLERVEQDARAAKGGALTETERTDLAEGVARKERAQQAVDRKLDKLQRSKLGELVDKARSENQKPGGAPTLDEARDALAQNAERDPEGGIDKHLLFELARAHIRKGITGLDDLLGKLHTDLKEHIEGVTIKEIRDALSDYGKARYPSKDAIERELAEMKQQSRLVSALEDAQAGRPPLRTGFQRGKPSDLVRELTAKVKEAMREKGIATTTPEQQLASALDGAKTRLRNAVKDLLKQFETGQGKPAKRGIELDAEAERIKQVRDALKQTLAGIDGKADAAKVRQAAEAVQQAIAEYERRIAERDFSPRNGPKPKETPELKALRAQRDALRETYQNMVDALFPQETPEARALRALKTRIANRTQELNTKLITGDFAKPAPKFTPVDTEYVALVAENERAKDQVNLRIKQLLLDQRQMHEKVADALNGWNRFFKLSGIKTLAKLANYSLTQFATVPLTEAAGGIFAHVPGLRRVSKMAPSEGGFSARALAQYYVGIYRGMGDAVQTFRTGKSDTRALHEAEKLPTQVRDWMGLLHEIEKSPARRAGYELALQKRFEKALRDGVDPSDPLHFITLSTLAWHDSAGHILMEQNRLAGSIRFAIRQLERPDPVTGKVPVGAKAGAMVAKLLFTIVKVPANFVVQSLRYTGGTAAGAARLAAAHARGIEHLRPEEADRILRDFKQGSIGLGMAALGWFAPQAFGGFYTGDKRKEGDLQPGQMSVGGFKTKLIHHPVFEPAMMFASLRRMHDHALEKDSEAQVTLGEFASATLGLFERAPVANEGMQLSKFFQPREARNAVGNVIRGNTVPQLVQNIAGWTDLDPLTGEPIRRAPKGIADMVKLGLPGLRQQVPRYVPPELRLR